MKNLISSRLYLILLTILAAVLMPACNRSSSGSQAKTESPNVLFIAIEDFNPEHFGCYGGKAVTPNIDQFASEGVLFTNAFVDVAVCNPSRTALLTGLRPATSGVFGNSDKWMELALPQIESTMPQHFMKNGYETVKIGKMFHYQMEHDASWNRILTPHVENGKILSSFHKDVIPLLKKVENDNSKGWFNENLQWGPIDCKPEEFRDGAYVGSVSDYLAEEHEKPFFLGVGFHAPHVKFAAPAEFFDMYVLDEIELPENPPDDLMDVPVKLEKNPIHDVMDSTQWREIKRAQLACISYVDWCIGKVLAAVKENELDENTIIVIWTDHGFGLGEHFQWSKGGNKLFSEINEVGYIWKVPGLTPEGKVSASVVETIDMFPTLFDLCNIDIPDYVQGESLAEVLKDPSAKIKDAAFTWGSRQRVSIQTERYRLNMNRDLDPDYFELYDHENDPGEFTNVSSNSEYSETIELLISYYKDHIEKYGLFKNE